MNKLTIAVIAVLVTGCATNIPENFDRSLQNKPVEYIETQERACYYDDSREGLTGLFEITDFFNFDEHPYKSIELTESELPTKTQWYHRPKPKPSEIAGIEFKVGQNKNNRPSELDEDEWIGEVRRGDSVSYLSNFASTGNVDGRGETYKEWYDQEVDERKYNKWRAKEAIENNDSSNWKCQMVTRKRPKNTPYEMPQEWLDQWPNE